MNLLKETNIELATFKFTPEDIIFIGSVDGNYECSWNEFCELANFEYDDGYGGTEVVSDLVIRFKDGSFLERWEYDGSEGWRCIKAFVPKSKTKKIQRLKFEGPIDECKFNNDDTSAYQ